MVGFHFGNSSKQHARDYYLFRRKAERTAHSLDEFSDQEIEKYDLEELDFGKYKDSTFEIDDRPIKGETWEEFDLRELDTR